jgi:serine/threonine protein kinase/formylglycine-generating enzyme required for sulfatase activity
MISCPSLEQFGALLAERLPPDQAQALEDHATACPLCQHALEQLGGNADLSVLPERPGAERSLDGAVDGEEFLRRLGQHAPPEVRPDRGPTDETETLGRAAADLTPLPILPGYEILGELGRGGMGVVYKAHQKSLKRIVAIKMLVAGGEARPQVLARFHMEAEAVARLRHPNIVPIYEVGEHSGRPFYVMELVEGISLADKLGGTPLPVRQAAELTLTLALAMDHAHRQGIVHRDLKPANILVSGEGRGAGSEQAENRGSLATIKIADFGLAKLLDGDSGPTRSGEIMGTPSYMAPEQAAGKGGAIGPATDIYGLGAILYELLTGRPSFRAETPLDTLQLVISEEPVPPRRLQPKVPRDLDTICLKCLEKDPRRRYASAALLAGDLQRFLEERPIVARLPGLLDRTLKWTRRRPAQAALLVSALVLTLSLLVAGLVYARRLEQARAAGLVRSVKDADIGAVPRLVEELEAYRTRADPLLEEELAAAAPDGPERVRLSLALLPRDPGQVEFLTERLLASPPEEVSVIVTALQPHQREVAPRLWTILTQSRTTPGIRLRAACALARFTSTDERWSRVSSAVVATLLAEDPLLFGRWTEMLRPLRARLAADVRDAWRDSRRSDLERLLAVSLLADYAADQPEMLVDRLGDADKRQFAVLWPVVERNGAAAVTALRRQLTDTFLPKDSAAARQSRVQRQVNSAAALLRFGHGDPAWPLFRLESDPDTRSQLVHRLDSLGVDARLLIEHLEEESDAGTRRALILALGEYPDDHLPDELRKRLAPRLLEWYQHDPDPGIHAAIGWLLGNTGEGPASRLLDWKQASALHLLDEKLRGAVPPTGRRWYVNRQGQTLAIVWDPEDYLMGSPGQEFRRGEDEVLHRRRIGRSFAIGTKTVTVAQFQRFVDSRPGFRHYYKERVSPDADCPIINVSWYEAAQYCRWLSEQEQIAEPEMCYPAVAELEKYKDGKTPLKLPADYLRRTGYRLPTEAEWEYACRAGTRTARYYGDGDELLSRYAWYIPNSQYRTWPVGQKKPNDLGLFDMLGNVWQWCHDSYQQYPASPEGPTLDREDPRPVSDSDRVLRGGSFEDDTTKVRSACRVHGQPINWYDDIGFRIARTVRR